MVTTTIDIVMPNPDREPTNSIRAARIDVLFKAYDATKGESIGCADEDDLASLLADIRHWCDRENIDLYTALDWSYQHYLQERTVSEQAT